MLREWFYEKLIPLDLVKKCICFAENYTCLVRMKLSRDICFLFHVNSSLSVNQTIFWLMDLNILYTFLEIYLSSAAYYFGLSPSKSFLHNPWFHNSLTGSKNYHHCWSPPNHHFLISVISCSYSYSCSI